MKSNSTQNLLISILIAHLAATAFGAILNHKHPNHGNSVPVNHEHPNHGHSVPVQPHHQNHLHAKQFRSFWSNPTSDIISYGTKLQFTVNITNLATDCFESSTFTLNKLQWKVKFCKVSGKHDNRIEDALDGSLIYSFDEFDDNWLIEARAVFQLAITNEKIDGKIVKGLKHEFNNDVSQRSIELIDWSALLANCVVDDHFSVNVKVFVGPKSNSAIDMTQVAADLRVVVDDVSELGETSSPVVNLQGIGWQVDISIDLENVGVSLKRNGGFDLSSSLDINEWSWNVTMSLSLLPVNDDAKPITKQFTHVFYLEQNVGYPNFVSYANFTKSYVQNNKATFVVNLKVDSPQPLWKVGNEMENLNKLF